MPGRLRDTPKVPLNFLSLTDFITNRLSSWKSEHGLDSLSPDGKAVSAHVAELLNRPGRQLLHVGCGPATKARTCPGFQSDDWNEIRLDIDPAAAPDVVCSILDMAPVPDAGVDAVFSSHNIEHLYPHEVELALAEFLRVLKPDGFLLLTCPDLQSVCQLVAEDKLTESAYSSPSGPIAPLDILYGHRPQLAAGNLYMAHHSGFTLNTLMQACKNAGFRSVIGAREDYNLRVFALKSPRPEVTLRHLATGFIPDTSLPVEHSAELFLRPGRKLLHVGCGPVTKSGTGPGFQSDDWQEIRLDIDPQARPDILGTLVDMSAVPDASVDAVFTAHTLEHLYAHEIPLALAEMKRVLGKDGFALSTVPDLQAAAKMIAEDRLFEVAYQSAAGAITPFDIVFSYRGVVGRDRPYMAHHSGFTLSTLVQAFKDAGFHGVIGVAGNFDLWVLAMESPQPEEKLRSLATEFIPVPFSERQRSERGLG
jgi:predicted SAM-dependent methyltransferase